MYAFAALSSLMLATLAAAQSNGSVVIQVGTTADARGGMFQFIPNNVTASNGTVVTFRFTGVPGNHSVTQSTFAAPCFGLANGFDSGWVLVPSTPNPPPEWNLTITDDTKPLWFFCKQLIPAPHCSVGMVGAINAPTTGNNTLANYQANAKAFTGTPPQGEGSLVGMGASASAFPSPLASGIMLATATSQFPSASAGAGAGNGTGSGTGAGSGAASPSPTSGASIVSYSPIVILLATLASFMLA